MSTTYRLTITDQTPTPVRPLGPVDYTGKGAHMRITSPIAASSRGVDPHTTGVIWLTAILLGLLIGLVTDATPTGDTPGRAPVVARGPVTTQAPALDAPDLPASATVEPVAGRSPVTAEDTRVDITPDIREDTAPTTTEPAPTTTSTSTPETTTTTVDTAPVTTTTTEATATTSTSTSTTVPDITVPTLDPPV